MALVKRFFHDVTTNYFLFGPRGTGKTTWLKSYYHDALYIDLLSPDIFRQLTAKPERIREIIEGNPGKKTIIIDEIQKVPELLSVIHQLIEENKNLKYVLTGSSSRKLKRTGIDLLAGRAINKTLHPFVASEIGKDFLLEKALKYGMLPLVYNSKNKKETLDAYIALYLKEEVQQEGLVRNMGNFTRFLEAISFSHASVLNVSEIARECEVSRKTVEGYVSILEDLLLSFKIPVFTKKAKRNLVKHEKFYLFDTGVFRTIRPVGPLDRPSEIDGACIEGLIAQHLKAWISYSIKDFNLYYWRTKAGNEVDFIIYGEKGLWAIEVKNSNKIHKKDLYGLKSFREDYPIANCILLYRGKEKLKKENILCIPSEYFLLSLKPDMPI